MSKIKKYSLMIIISIIILILSSSTCVYANNYIADMLGSNQDGWFCVQKNTDPANGGISQVVTHTYRSDSLSQFERAFAYIMKDAYDSPVNNKTKTNDFRIGLYPGIQPNAGMHQNCLWRLLYEYGGRDSASDEFKDSKYKDVNAIDFNNIKDSYGFTKDAANNLYNAAINAKRDEFFVENADIKTDGLKMNAETDIGSLKITKLSGTIKNIKIYWADGTNEQISTKTSSTYFQIYSNRDCTQTKDISSIKANETIYIKNKKDSDIINMEIEVSQEGKGYKVTFELYESEIGQNAIHAVVEKGESTSKKQGIDVSYGKLTVKKEDYDYNYPLNNAQFAIYYKGSKDSGWIGYQNNQITFGNTWNNRYEFETGKGYCGDVQVDGEFTIRKLRNGTYTVFEVKTPDGYDLDGQPGYMSLKNYGADGNYGVLNGYDAYCSGYISAKIGSESYSFSEDNGINYSGNYGWNSNNSQYTSDKLIYTVKNKKANKLVVNKKDKDTNLSIKNVGIKIFVHTLEKIQYKDVTYDADSWLWLRQDKTLTNNINEAYEFKTDRNGKIELSNVPYGKYYIYETTPGDGYVLSEQKRYKIGAPVEGIDNFFDSKIEYVYLGSNIINKQEYTPEIKDGIYMLSSKLNDDLVLDVQGGKLKSLTSIQTHKKNDSLAQMFMIKYVGNGYYTIRSLCTDKYFDVANGIIGPGARIWQYDKNETDAQLWRFSKTDDDSYCITSKLDNRYCLDIPEGKDEPDLPMQMYLRNNSDAQKFNLIRQEDQESKMNVKEGNYEIYLNYSPNDLKLAVDIANASNDKANVWLHRSNKSDAQKFTITYIGDGYYIIRNISSNKIVMTEKESAANSINILQDLFCIDGVRDNYYSQSGYKWKFEYNSGGYYTITSKLNNGTSTKYVIDADGGQGAIDKNLQNLKDGKANINLQLYENNDTIAQQFLLQPLDKEKNIIEGNSTIEFNFTNKKNSTELIIEKKDESTGELLENVGIKVLVKTLDSNSGQNKWGWIKSDGSLTTNANEAYRFETDENGLIGIQNIQAGTFYLYETKAANGYDLRTQNNYNKGKPSDYTGSFITEPFVYLGKLDIN